MKLNARPLLVALFAIVLALTSLAFTPAPAQHVVAQTPQPPAAGTPVVTTLPAAPATDPGPNDAVFVAELIAITAFFQKRFGLGGYALMGAAGAVGVVLWIDSGETFVKLFLSAMGSVDFVTTVGSKIAAANKAVPPTPTPAA